MATGVIGDMRADGRADDAPPELYMPAAQWRANRQMTYVMRSALPEAALVPMIRKAVAGVDPMLALSAVSTMDDSIARREGLSRFAMWLLTLVGATGLVLAAVGVYGVVSYGVTQRRHEFGVRIALGATESSVRWLVMRQGAILAMVGVGLGTAAAYGLSRFLRSLIFGVTTHDLMTFVVVAVSLTLVVIVASYIPSHRATRVDPLQALRRQ